MRSDATCREPGLVGGKGLSSRSMRRKNRKPQTVCTCTDFSTIRWHSGRTIVLRFETGEANLVLLEWLIGLSTSMSELWAYTAVGLQMCLFICLHVRRNREQQACHQGDLRCMKWALDKWKKVLYVVFVLSSLYSLFIHWLKIKKNNKV